MQNYLYRVDAIGTFREILANGHLRGMQGVDPDFPHHQVVSAQAAAHPGDGAFRLSMWRTLADAKGDVAARGSKDLVLQRIPTNHPLFAGYSKGNDQFCTGTAWIFWATRKATDKVERAPDGVTITDIEALEQDGTWKPCSDLTCVGGVVPGWTMHSVSVLFGTATLLAKTVELQTSKGLESWLVLREPHGALKMPTNDTERCTSALDHIEANIAAFDPYTRVLLSRERSGAPFLPMEMHLYWYMPPPPRWWRKALAAIFPRYSIPPAKPIGWTLTHLATCKPATVHSIYTAAGLPLAGDSIWCYQPSVLAAVV